MLTAIATISSKGQLVVPKEIRDQMRWGPGTQLTLHPSASGVLLKTASPKAKHKFEDLIGMLQHTGPALALDELCRPVDLDEPPLPDSAP